MDARKTVLNVDDHAPARFLRTRILQRAGFGVEEAETAAGAIRQASGASLVLLDVRLPDADGFSVCEQVKKQSPKTPIVMVTSVYRTAQARRDAFAVGADAFLLEPVDPLQLVRTVEDLVGRGAEATATVVADPWLVTDAAGQILKLSEGAVQLLNLSARGARSRNLLAFFAENRPKLMMEILRAAEGITIERTTVLRPRDRRPVRVRIDVSRVPHDPGDRVELRWVISPETR